MKRLLGRASGGFPSGVGKLNTSDASVPAAWIGGFRFPARKGADQGLNYFSFLAEGKE
jgi:hypothetical protein